MSIKEKLKVESLGMFSASVFYAVSGIVCLAVLASDLALIHIGLIGILSLATAFGLFKKRAWALWFIIILFFMITTFSVSMLYYTMGGNILLDGAMAAYLILTWIFTAYMAAKRKKLEG
ncbi:MAG: hypothetical protein ACPLRY_01415 [Candidatus Bathyarchaeales archaeon]